MWIRFLSLNCSYARQYLAFDSFEESTTAGGDVANLILKAELMNASYAVTATDERESTFGSCSCHCIAYCA